MKVDRAIYAVLRHRFDNYGAEPTVLRLTHGRPIALGPAHGEGVADGPPRDIDATPIRRKRPVFPGVGGELVERKPDGLRGSCLEAQLGAMDADARTNEVGEERELGANQGLDLDPLPCVSNGSMASRTTVATPVDAKARA